MIRLGLRLTLAGGREAVARLLVTAVAVALGVGMVLIALSGINAVNAQNARYAWLETGTGPSVPAHAGDGRRTDAAGAPTAVWWRLTADEFRGSVIGRVDVAPTGARSPVPPGIPRLPAPGEFYASPALSRLLRTVPSAQLADRYAGRQIGIIGPAALPSPSSLVLVVGRTVPELSHVPGAQRITQIDTTVPSSCNGACYDIGIDASGIDLILAIAAGAILFPVLIFIGTASRLSTARREQRFAAMRLVGATPRQVSVISTVESTVAAAAGVLGGFVLFYLLRPVLATISFTGTRFYSGDLSPSLLDVVLVAVGVPVAAALAARLALRRVQISPLGVTRRVTPKPPRAYRVIPLVMGLGELAYFVHAGRPATTPGQIRAYLTGFLITMAGLVIAGPWLTLVGSRLMARRTGRPSVLIAGRRLSDNPQAGFRAISGLVLALFVTSVAIALITTIDAYSGDVAVGAQARDTLVDQFTDVAAPGPFASSIRSLPGSLLAELHAIPGVTAVTLVHADPGRGMDGPASGLVSCAQLSGTPALGRCVAGADAATLTPDFGRTRSSAQRTVWPGTTISTTRLNRLPVQSIAVATQGAESAIERARTDLEVAYPYIYPATTIAENDAQNPNTQRDTEYRQLVDVVILTTLPIAGCGLAVSVAVGLSERRRPFSLLRLTGVPLSMLRRVIALETAVPLVVIAAVSIGVGFLAAGLFLKSQLAESLQSPGPGYYISVVAGLLLSFGVIASTFPMLERTTGPETARNE